MILSVSEEPMVAKEHPNLGLLPLGFGSATVGHATVVALAGISILTTVSNDVVNFPVGSTPKAIRDS